MPSLGILALQDSSSTEVTGTLVSVDPAPAQVFVNTRLMLRPQLLSPPASLHINCLEVSSESSNLQKQYRPNFQAGMFKYISLYTQKMLLKQMLSSGNGWDLLCKGALCRSSSLHRARTEPGSDSDLSHHQRTRFAAFSSDHRTLQVVLFKKPIKICKGCEKVLIWIAGD